MKTARRASWLWLALSALSGILLTRAMPGYDVLLLSWIALTPLLVVLFVAPSSQVFLLTFPFGIFFSSGVHNLTRMGASRPRGRSTNGASSSVKPSPSLTEPFYTRSGDWFGWFVVGALVLLPIRAWVSKSD